ncbi:MAG: lipocalin family protein [Bacteroidetes bacterium]|nr:lipocalin family protein [Bacteroidota bacterium]
MKKTIGILTIVSTIYLMVACNAGPEKKLIGSWKLDSFQITNIDELVNKSLEAAPDSLKDSLRQANQATYEAMQKVEISMNLKEDLTYEMLIAGQTEPEKGTWKISEDGKTFTTKVDGAEVDNPYVVSELTDIKLSCEGEDDGMKMKFSYSKTQ